MLQPVVIFIIVAHTAVALANAFLANQKELNPSAAFVKVRPILFFPQPCFKVSLSLITVRGHVMTTPGPRVEYKITPCPLAQPVVLLPYLGML